MKSNITSILKFNLDTEEGRDAHMRALKADKAYRALTEIDEALRQYTKYGSGIEAGDKYPMPLGSHEISTSDSILLHEFVDNLRTQINEIIEDCGINISDEYK